MILKYQIYNIFITLLKPLDSNAKDVYVVQVGTFFVQVNRNPKSPDGPGERRNPEGPGRIQADLNETYIRTKCLDIQIFCREN